ncbi:MAG: hypothetical protein ACXVDA_03615 [Ktedonobacterales bacterium]
MDATFEIFYQTIAQLCFTLLGLWWIVLQTKYREWISDSDRRRTATNISFYFLLPGSMSLLSLLSAGVPVLWRAAFATASFLGIIETVLLLRRIQAKNSRLTLLALARWAGLALYLLVALVALIPTLSNMFHVKPLLITGSMLTLLVVLGVSLAWAFFIQPVPDTTDSRRPSR